MRVALLTLAVTLPAAGQLTWDRILASAKEPHNWLTYSGNLLGHRYSPLSQVTTQNVARLRPSWVFQMDLNHKLETSPLVVDGVMYLTEPPSSVTALDARTGRPYWRYRRRTDPGVVYCCGQVNRGLAMLGDSLFLATVDAHLVALDARNGAVRWDVVQESPKLGYTGTGAPLIVKDKVISGIAGGEYGIRGFLDAYSAADGLRHWRHFTVPDTGEPGVETWKGDSYKTGGGPTWVTGTYDPELNLVYWGTGNPAPDHNDDARQGDNLYTNSLLAIDPDTGRRRWHFQFTPGDVFDYDSNQVPVLVDAVYQGKPRKLVVTANRNGYYYILDRVTGEFLHGVPFAKVTWATGLDAKGRPVKDPKIRPSVEGTLAYPGGDGAVNWPSPAYHPGTKLFYVSVREEGSVMLKLPVPEARMGAPMIGGGWQPLAERERWGAVRALDVTTGKQVWEFRLQQPPWSGVLATAGGLVFAGSEEGAFYALDAASGKLLWRFTTGGRIIANLISYSAGGKQYVVIASGQAIFAFSLE